VVEKLIDFGFNEMKLHKIYGRITPGHTASIRVLEKFGFRQEGELRDDEFAQNRYFDTAIYSLIKNT
jgi:ribosomal-protein-alanine N-acetyltransferase